MGVMREFREPEKKVQVPKAKVESRFNALKEKGIKVGKTEVQELADVSPKHFESVVEAFKKTSGRGGKLSDYLHAKLVSPKHFENQVKKALEHGKNFDIKEKVIQTTVDEHHEMFKTKKIHADKRDIETLARDFPIFYRDVIEAYEKTEGKGGCMDCVYKRFRMLYPQGFKRALPELTEVAKKEVAIDKLTFLGLVKKHSEKAGEFGQS
jgi:hypothetical protein